MDPMLFADSPVGVEVVEAGHYAAAKLADALEEHRYGAAYAILRKLQAPLGGREARECCMRAMWCPPRLFGAVLDRCIPPRRTARRWGGRGYPFAPELVSVAVQEGKPDHLDHLLRRGCAPNFGPPGTALRAAIARGGLRCVERLLQAPDLDRAVTPNLLRHWASGDSGDRDLDRCLLAAAPHIPCIDTPDGGFPIPAGMTLSYLTSAGNLKMARRLCRALPVSADEGCRFLEGLVYTAHPPEEVAELLDAMFTACPALLRRRWPRAVLAMCALGAEGGVPPTARPWLDRLPGKQLVLVPDATIPWVTGEGDRPGLLARWEERMPSRLTPTVDRRSPMAYWKWSDREERGRALEALLARCAVTGSPTPGRLSLLGECALTCLPPGALLRALEPGGLLAGEDPAALTEAALAGSFPRDRRNLLLMYIRREVRYAL